MGKCPRAQFTDNDITPHSSYLLILYSILISHDTHNVFDQQTLCMTNIYRLLIPTLNCIHHHIIFHVFTLLYLICARCLFSSSCHLLRNDLLLAAWVLLYMIHPLTFQPMPHVLLLFKCTYFDFFYILSTLYLRLFLSIAIIACFRSLAFSNASQYNLIAYESIAKERLMEVT